MKEEQSNKKPRAEQEGSAQQSSNETPIYTWSDATLQTPEEHEHDQSIDPRQQDVKREASKDDLHETNSDRMAGSDRAGTVERKDNSISTGE